MSQRPDSVTARDHGGGFDPHPEGQFAMLCVDVVNLGRKIDQYPGQPAREVEKAALVFASGERQENELRTVTAEMTLSMNEKASMRKFLESWRGKSYTAEQAEAGVPLDKLHGQAALVSVQHITTKAGRRFAKVISISPLPKAMPAPPASVLDEYTRPKFLEDRKLEFMRQVAAHRAQHGAADPGPPPMEDDLDDLPF